MSTFRDCMTQREAHRRRIDGEGLVNYASLRRGRDRSAPASVKGERRLTMKLPRVHFPVW